MLPQTLADVRKRIAKNRKMNELATRAALIDPVLAALGWDVMDPDEVAREHKPPRGKPVDYALLVLREPKLYVEAKALGENLGDSKVAHQIMGYAAVAGVEWVVLTNGDEWRIYNSHATVPIAEKLLRSFKISDAAGGAEEILGLLSKEQLRTKQIDALWRAHFVDRKVKAALEGFFDPDRDMSLVNHVRSVAKDLTAEDVRGSMRRCKLTLDFPLSPGDLLKAKKPKDAPKAKAPASGITLADIINAGLLKAPQKLTRRYKGQLLEAVVARDGTVEFQGKTYATLSTAGQVALASQGVRQKDGSMPTINGWNFWRIAGPGGKPRAMNELRQRLAGQRVPTNAAG